jgi:hypothetical protein
MMFLSLPMIRYILVAAFRDRLLLAMFGLMLLSGVISILLTGAVIMEQAQFAVASLASSMRIVTIVGLVVFISFFQRRAHEYREVDYLLATPLGRYRYILSVAAAFTLIALLSVIIMMIMLAVVHRYYSPVLLYWGASAFVEVSLTVTFALFMSTRLRSATVCTLITLAFYSLARLMGAVLGAMDSGIMEKFRFYKFYDFAIDVMAVLIPRFDVLAQSQWLIYEKVEGITPLFLVGQWTVFTALFLSCAAFDLRRNQF